MIDWANPDRATVEDVEVELASIMAKPPNESALLHEATIRFLRDWLTELRSTTMLESVDNSPHNKSI
jgi:hypothetical protein